MEFRNTCPCGSGKFKHELYDARGIFCCYMCDDCEKKKREHYRLEVLTNPTYEADDLGDDEELE